MCFVSWYLIFKIQAEYYLTLTITISIWQIYYDTEDHAMESVMNGDTYASIVVRENYSDALRRRLDDWRNSQPWDIKASEIEVLRDLTSSYLFSNKD